MKIEHDLNISHSPRFLPKIDNFFYYKKLKYSKEDKELIFQKEVIENVDFQRHISETALKLNIPEYIVHTVVTHYFFTNLLKLKYLKQRIRIVIYQFFYIEQINPLENEYSNYYKHKLKNLKNVKYKRQLRRANGSNDNTNDCSGE
jgi:hypothetical protein